MLRYSLDFVQAARRLGCWSLITDADRLDLAQRRRKQRQEQDAAECLAAAIDRLRFEYRAEIHAMERIIREMQERLLCRQLTTCDFEACGSVLSMALDELRVSLAAYHLLSFGARGEASYFVKFPNQRDAAINAVLNRGTVRDDHGYVMEISFP